MYYLFYLIILSIGFANAACEDTKSLDGCLQCCSDVSQFSKIKKEEKNFEFEMRNICNEVNNPQLKNSASQIRTYKKFKIDSSSTYMICAEFYGDPKSNGIPSKAGDYERCNLECAQRLKSNE